MNGGEAREEEGEKMETEKRKKSKYEVLMWGYLPGASPQKSPLISPVALRLPNAEVTGYSWKEVCGGGCGFAMAISDVKHFSKSRSMEKMLCNCSYRTQAWIVLLNTSNLNALINFLSSKL